MLDITDVIRTYNQLVWNIDNNKTELEKLNGQLVTISDALYLLLAFSEATKNEVKSKIEGIANIALKTIFINKSMKFRIIPNKNKKGLYYVPYVETEGKITPLRNCKGGGVLDIISLCIRISYLRIFKSQLEQLLFLDEPFRNLDKTRLEIAVEWLNTISKEMKIQMVIVTHIEALMQLGDVSYKLKESKGISTCTKIN